jgi:hypothetical protein
LLFWLRGADERQLDVPAYWRCLSIGQSTPSVVDSRSEFLSAWRGIEWSGVEWSGMECMSRSCSNEFHENEASSHS